MADNLTDGLNELAQGFQKRFKVSDKLTIQDMIKLITPPAPLPETEILGRTKISEVSYGQSKDISLTLETVPPVMSKPIKLLITVSGNNWLSVSSAELIFNKSDGTQLSLAIPDIDTDFAVGEHLVKTVSVTIPANTSIANNKAIFKIGGLSSVDTIEKISATYE